MFDQLLLLSEGRTIYLGPASNAAAYFTSQHLPPPNYYNPADFYLDMLSPDNRSKEQELETGTRIYKLSQAWRQSCGVSTVEGENEGENGVFAHDSPLRQASLTAPAEVDMTEYTSIKPSDQKMDFSRFVRIVRLLYWRSLTGQLRLPQALIARTVVSIAFGGIIGGMYSDLSNDQRSIDQL